jgi:hypothetical protein
MTYWASSRAASISSNIFTQFYSGMTQKLAFFIPLSITFYRIRSGATPVRAALIWHYILTA